MDTGKWGVTNGRHHRPRNATIVAALIGSAVLASAVLHAPWNTHEGLGRAPTYVLEHGTKAEQLQAIVAVGDTVALHIDKLKTLAERDDEVGVQARHLLDRARRHLNR